MKTLFPPIFKNTIRMKPVWLYLGFAGIPFVMMIAMMINSNFLQINSDPKTLSTIEYSGMITMVTHNMVLPIIVLSFIVSKLFYEEIHSGILFMYKDISKTKILVSKWLTLFLIHLGFTILLLINSIIVYFIYLNGFDFASGTFMPLEAQSLNEIIQMSLSIYVIQLILINITIALSISFSTGFTIFGTIVAYAFMTLAPQLKLAKYIVPNGYESMVTSDNLVPMVLIVLVIAAIYFALTSWYSIKKFEKIEY